VVAGTSSEELEDFVGAEFYCPHALADGNQRIRIREKMLELSLTVSSTLSPYLNQSLYLHKNQQDTGCSPTLTIALKN